MISNARSLPLLLLAQLLACHPAAIQQQEMLDEAPAGYSARAKRQARTVARKQGLASRDADRFAQEALENDLQNDPEESCRDPDKVCSYNDVVRCPGTVSTQTPADTRELAALIRKAAQQGHRLRPIGALHTANKAICPDGEPQIALSLAAFDHLEIDAERKVARVGAGMLLKVLHDLLLARGYMLGTAVPFFRGVTVGGALATAAHGSSWTRSSVISSNVVALKLLDGHGEEHSLTAADGDLWLAALASMGTLGVITEVSFNIVPSRDALLTTGVARDRRIVHQDTSARSLRALLGGAEFGQFLWFPNAQRYLWTRVVAEDEPVRETLAKASLRDYENAMLSPHVGRKGIYYARKYLNAMTQKRGNCWLEQVGLNRFKRGIVRAIDDSKQRRRWRRGRGPMSRMITSEVLPNQDLIPQIDFEFAFPAERAGEILELAEKVLDGANRCLPLVGVFVRFSHEPMTPTTLIGHSAIRPAEPKPGEGGRVMFFEFVVYAPKYELENRDQSAYLHAYDTFAADLVKLGGWPHWAKNNTTLLRQHAASDPVYAERLERFRRIADCLDPSGVFTSDFAEDVQLRSRAGERETTTCAVPSSASQTPP